MRETKRVQGERLYVELKYPDGTEEQFDWEMFTEVEMNALARAVGLIVRDSCTDFDSAKPPSSNNPRIQFLLERTGYI